MAKKELIEGLKELEKVLGDKLYFGGDTFGLLTLLLSLSIVGFIPMRH